MPVKKRPALAVQDILDTLRPHLPSLRRRYGVRSQGVFGSCVRGEQRKRSDVDLLVEFEQDHTPSLFGFVALQEELGDLLGANVDLVERKGLKPRIGRHILEQVIDISEGGRAGIRQPNPWVSDASRGRKREIGDYLQDILDNVGYVERFTEGMDLETFSSDTQRVYAVLHTLLIVGEAARKVPAPTRRTHPEVPWRNIVGLRNVVADEYFAVNLPRIWQIVREELPRLRAAVTAMLTELEGGGCIPRCVP